MRTIRRAIRALIRSPLRGALLVGVLAVSIGLALIMITVNGAFAQRLDDIRATVGTDITVRPAGTFGGGAFSFGGGGGANGENVTPDDGSDQTATQPTLTDDDLQQLTSIPHVASITRVVTERYTGDTLIAPTIEPPAGAQINGQAAPAGFTPPIIVTGTDDANTLASLVSGDTTHLRAHVRRLRQRGGCGGAGRVAGHGQRPERRRHVHAGRPGRQPGDDYGDRHLHDGDDFR